MEQEAVKNDKLDTRTTVFSGFSALFGSNPQTSRSISKELSYYVGDTVMVLDYYKFHTILKQCGINLFVQPRDAIRLWGCYGSGNAQALADWLDRISTLKRTARAATIECLSAAKSVALDYERCGKGTANLKMLWSRWFIPAGSYFIDFRSESARQHNILMNVLVELIKNLNVALRPQCKMYTIDQLKLDFPKLAQMLDRTKSDAAVLGVDLVRSITKGFADLEKTTRNLFGMKQKDLQSSVIHYLDLESKECNKPPKGVAAGNLLALMKERKEQGKTDFAKVLQSYTVPIRDTVAIGSFWVFQAMLGDGGINLTKAETMLLWGCYSSGTGVRISDYLTKMANRMRAVKTLTMELAAIGKTIANSDKCSVNDASDIFFSRYGIPGGGEFFRFRSEASKCNEIILDVVFELLKNLNMEISKHPTCKQYTIEQLRQDFPDFDALLRTTDKDFVLLTGRYLRDSFSNMMSFFSTPKPSDKIHYLPCEEDCDPTCVKPGTSAKEAWAVTFLLGKEGPKRKQTRSVRPRSVSASRKSPEGAKISSKDAKATVAASRRSPKDAAASRRSPKDAAASRRSPKDAAASRRSPKDAAASRRSPKDAAASRRSPKDAAASRRSPKPSAEARRLKEEQERIKTESEPPDIYYINNLRAMMSRNEEELDALEHKLGRFQFQIGAPPTEEEVAVVREKVVEKKRELIGRQNLLRAAEAKAAGKEPDYQPLQLPSPPKRTSPTRRNTPGATRSGKWYQNLF